MTTAAAAEVERDYEFDPPPNALDVLRTELIEPYSDQDVDEKATIWEAANGELLRRPWETFEQFLARASNFKTYVKALSLNMDPVVAKQELDRILEGVDDPKTLSAGHQARIHELEQIIGRAKTNFAKSKTRQEIMATGKLRYAEYAREEDFSKRIAWVEKEKQRWVVELLVKYDRNDSVRDAAKVRLAELDVFGG